MQAVAFSLQSTVIATLIAGVAKQTVHVNPTKSIKFGVIDNCCTICETITHALAALAIILCEIESVRVLSEFARSL